ncbi:MAG: glycosyltransferase family 1 protein [Chloroflexi bacterium]|nr:glycosyltransferase family 1 protein [Chloroflexota bacterium]
MKIAIVASGTRGDVQPYVALGKGLKAAGHTVRMLSNQDFDALVGDAGLEFHSIGVSVETLLQSDEWRATVEGGNFLVILLHMRRELNSRAQEFAARMPALVADVDLILTGMAGMGGTFSIAEKLQLPLIQAYVLPITPTGCFASPLVPKSLPSGMFNRLSFHAMRQMMWQSVRAGDVATRKLLGMPAAPFWGPYQSLKRKRVPVLYGFSQHVLPRPNDWDDLHHVTSYWFLDAPDDWQPPSDLVDFLRAGPPPVYIGFGSMGSRNPAAAARLSLEALALAGQRGVIASGWGGMHHTHVPDTVYMLRSAPHSWLFPQMAAVVHHGGAGTTAAGLRAGIPSILVPHMGDQPFWGQRVADLGVGPAPIPRKRLTAERLAKAITQAISDTGMRRRAADLGIRIRAEDGVAQAVSLIERFSERV